MIKHLFKLIWNKKRANLLITIEILCSFLVLFSVVVMTIVSVDRYKQPLGFNYKDVWLVDIDTRLTFDSSFNAVKKATVEQLLLSLRGMPEVRSVCAWSIPPYSGYMSTWGANVNGKFVRVAINNASEEGKEVFDLKLVEGRWFEATDRNLNWKPVVINQRFARGRFGNESAIGKNPFPKGDEDNDNQKPKEDYRVIGVITDFRKGGEFSESMDCAMEYFPVERTTQAISSNLLIKVAPGTTAEFKARLDQAMASVAKGWSFDIKTLEEMREADFKPRITFMITVGLIAAFLLLMVALGLIGVLWQNVSRRTHEIGLRRALGSTERNIYKQILGELIMLTTFGLLVGTLIVIQFPLLDLISMVPTGAYIVSLLISIGFMYLLTILCGLYPSLLAVEIQPAEALHYE
jgi:putative ABC transport system permease protein